MPCQMMNEKFKKLLLYHFPEYLFQPENESEISPHRFGSRYLVSIVIWNVVDVVSAIHLPFPSNIYTANNCQTRELCWAWAKPFLHFPTFVFVIFLSFLMLVWMSRMAVHVMRKSWRENEEVKSRMANLSRTREAGLRFCAHTTNRRWI